MKKILAFILACFMLFTLVACGGNKEEVTPGDIEIIEPTTDNNGEVTEPSGGNESDTPTTPDATQDKDVFVDFDEDKVVYDKDNIKITFVNAEFDVGGCDEFSFKVENKSSKDIMFTPSTVVLNGFAIECVTDETATLAGEENFVIAYAESATRAEVLNELGEVTCCDFEALILENPAGEYRKFSTVIEDNFHITLTKGGSHSHGSDTIVKNGKVVYEDEEVVIYIDTNATKAAFADAFKYTIINKTNQPILFNITKAEYKTKTITEFYQGTSTFGIKRYLSPNSYTTGDFRLFDTKYDDITEMKLTLFCGKATMLDALMSKDINGNMQCSGKVITVFTEKNEAST